MDIVLAIPSLQAGGAERVLTVLANAWTTAGWRVRLVTTHAPSDESFYPLHPRIGRQSLVDPELPPLRNSLTANLQRVRRLRRLITEHPPGIVLSFLNYTNVLVLSATGGLRCPVVVAERADPIALPIGPLWSFLRRVTYRRAAAVVCQTAAAAEYFRPWLGDRVRVIPNPVAVPVLDESPEFVVPRPGLIAVGRMHPAKGFDLLIEAFARVAPDHPDWHLTILGEGPLRRDLERLVEQSGLGDRIHMPGRVGRVHPVLASSDVFVLSSRTEGFPNVLCEAMAVGLPVVAMDCPSGPREIVTHGRDGLLVSPVTPTVLARTLSRVMSDENLRRRLAKRAPDILERYSVEAILREWAGVLEGAARGEGPSRGAE